MVIKHFIMNLGKNKVMKQFLLQSKDLKQSYKSLGERRRATGEAQERSSGKNRETI